MNNPAHGRNPQVMGWYDNRSTAEAHDQRSFHNRKPYRSKEMKAEARDRAKKVDGRFISTAHVQHHAPPKGNDQ